MIGSSSSRRGRAALAALALLVCGWTAPQAFGAQSTAATAQGTVAERDRLAVRVRERFEVLSLRDRVLLIPRRSGGDVRFIEIMDGTVSLNGQIASGRELHDRLGDDAPMVLQLSYLDDRARDELLKVDEPAPTAERGAEAADPSVDSGSVRERRRQRRSDDIVRIAGDVTVERDELVNGDVVVIGGNGRIDGLVTGDVAVIGGSLRLGPESEVESEVTVIGGQLDRAPGARVDGEVKIVDIGWRNLRMRIGNLDFPNPFVGRTFYLPRLTGLFATLLRLGLLVMFGWLFVAVARRPVQRISDRAGAEPLKAGLVGVLIELLFLPMLILVTFLLAISIVGIPLLALMPIALFLMILVLVAGFTGVAMRVGRWVGSRLGNDQLEPYASVTVGTVVLLSLAVLARFAFLADGFLGLTLGLLAFGIEYIAWTVGLGAAVLARLSPQSQPPPAMTVMP